MKPVLFALAAVSACALAASAHAEVYGKVEGGGTFSGKHEYGGVDAKTDGGWQLGGAVGASVTPNVRLEGEISHQRADFESSTQQSRATLGLANAYYDLAPDAQFTPFVGGGVGFARVDNGPADDTGFAYKLTAGAAAKFSDRVTGELAYRYTAAPDLTFGGVDAKYRENAITAGVRIKLGQ